jgi:hypothetical protein
MLVRVRTALLLLALVMPVAAATGPPEQTITPVAPAVEQGVEPVKAPPEQQVTTVVGDASGQVQPVPPQSAARRVAGGIAKVAVAVVGAGVAVGTTLAFLLLI